jgi:hypothetical protein
LAQHSVQDHDILAPTWSVGYLVYLDPAIDSAGGPTAETHSNPKGFRCVSFALLRLVDDLLPKP